jgi:hypothetical protein
MAPWGLVCFHLAAGESREWLPGPERENDWLCPACAADPDLSDDCLKLLCVYCIETIRKQFDPKLSG